MSGLSRVFAHDTSQVRGVSRELSLVSEKT
jgi:hypothetical protein